MNSGRATRRRSWVPWALFIITLAVYAPVVGHEFVKLDDETTVAKNPLFNPPSWAAIRHYWTHEHMGLWVPVTYTLWGLLALATYVPTPDESGIHVDPHVYHAASVLVHACAVVVVYGLLKRLLRRDRRDGATWAAAIGALAFAVHPVQVEGVAWASGLKDVLYAALSLVALWFYVRAVEQPSVSPPPPKQAAASASRSASPWARREYWAGLACFVIAMLCKPTAMVTPALAAVLDWILLQRPLKRVAAALWPWFALAVPVMVVAKVVQPGTGVHPVALWARPLVAGEALAFYLWKLLLPVRLSPDYGLRPPELIHTPWIWVAWLAPLALAVLLWRARRREPLIAAGGLFLVVAVLPMLGFTPYMFQYFSTVADHYLQLAMFGVAMVLVAVVARFASRVSARVLAVGVLCAWTALTFAQQRWWSDAGNLLRRTLALNPRSFMSHANMGAYLQGRHDYSGAENEYRAATRVNPEMMIPRGNLAELLASEGRLDEAMAVVREAEAVNATLDRDARIDMSDACYVLGMNVLSGGQPGFAIRFFEEQLQRTPNHAGARKGLTEARRQIAAATVASTKPATTTTKGSSP
jgi:protein O-mannosyl-transferase